MSKSYIKLEGNRVVQKQPYPEDGFMEVDESVVCGMIKTPAGFEAPVIEKPVESEREEGIRALQRKRFEEEYDALSENEKIKLKRRSKK